MAEHFPQETSRSTSIDVSVIMPIHNAEKWLPEALESLLNQNTTLRVELSAFFDSCTDNSEKILQDFIPQFQDKRFMVTIGRESNSKPKGVGYAKNKAVRQSNGQCLCFFDADDVMMENRILIQCQMVLLDKDTLIGARFRRHPADSTTRFTRWANTISPGQLYTQAYTSHGPTIIMPTWFCHRSVFDRVGGFSETGRGTPEDLIFFYSHLELGGRVARADEELLIYRYHPEATTFSVHEDAIWNLRMIQIQKRVLSHWTKFTIWNAGKQGRKFYRSLKKENQEKVLAFCDVDAKKVGSVYTYEESNQRPKPTVPILHFKEAQTPFVICVKLDLTGGNFERNLSSLNLIEGQHYIHFS